MGHYAIDKMNLRARETVYWPGISEDIKFTYHKCEICAKFSRTQQKETLQYIEMPQTVWEQLGLDLFTLRNMHYLLVINYFSCYPVIRKWGTQMHSFRWWHTVHVTRIPNIYKEMGHTTQNYIPHKYSIEWPSRAICTNYQEQSHQSNGGRRRPTFSNTFIYHNTPESQSTLTSKVTKFQKI